MFQIFHVYLPDGQLNVSEVLYFFIFQPDGREKVRYNDLMSRGLWLEGQHLMKVGRTISIQHHQKSSRFQMVGCWSNFSEIFSHNGLFLLVLNKLAGLNQTQLRTVFWRKAIQKSMTGVVVSCIIPFAARRGKLSISCRRSCRSRTLKT